MGRGDERSSRERRSPRRYDRSQSKEYRKEKRDKREDRSQSRESRRERKDKSEIKEEGSGSKRKKVLPEEEALNDIKQLFSNVLFLDQNIPCLWCPNDFVNKNLISQK